MDLELKAEKENEMYKRIPENTRPADVKVWRRNKGRKSHVCYSLKWTTYHSSCLPHTVYKYAYEESKRRADILNTTSEAEPRMLIHI